MGRKAKPIDQQVELLRKRGMIIHNPERVRELLLEIGWYRLSMYWFPFELRYPDAMSEHHQFQDGTHFEDAMMLYAFDFKLRNLLIRMLERIETSLRTYMIYHVSTRYPDSPTWFADEKIVGKSDALSFEKTVYHPLKRQNPEIILHHKRFPRDRFAPAWKTLEFVTLGTIINLYSSLRSSHLREEICAHFGVHSAEVFENYLDIIRALRNICAHGNILYAYRPSHILRGPALGGTSTPPANLSGALAVVEHFLQQISGRLLEEYRNDLKAIKKEFFRTPGTARILHKISGLKSPKYT